MNNENESVYIQAVARLEQDLGWTETDARDAIASYASAQGVFLDDVASAILSAASLKRGLGQALYGVSFRRHPQV
jgi:hypothetical protein